MGTIWVRIVIVMGVLLVGGATAVIFKRIREQSRKHAGSGSSRATSPAATTTNLPAGTPAPKKETWKKRVDKIVKFMEDNPLLIPVYVVVFWLVLTAILWCIAPESAKWGWPGGGVSVWTWVVIDHSGAYWASPILLTIGGLLFRVESKIVKTVALLFSLILIILWAEAILYTTEHSTWKQERDARTAAEKSRAKEQAAQDNRTLSAPVTIIVAKPGMAFSEEHVLNPYWEYFFDPKGPIEFIPDDKKPRKDGPGMLADYGRYTRKLRVRALGNEDVQIVVTVMSRGK